MKKMKFIEKINSLLYLEFVETIAGKKTEIIATPNYEENNLSINFNRFPFKYTLNLKKDKADITFGYLSSSQKDDYMNDIDTPPYISNILKNLKEINEIDNKKLKKDIDSLLQSLEEKFNKRHSADKELAIISDIQKNKKKLIDEIANSLLNKIK